MPSLSHIATSTEFLKGAVGTVTSLGGDFFAFLLVAAIAALYGFYAGRDRLAIFILAVYPAALLYTIFPYGDWIFKNFGGGPWIPLFLFLGIFVACIIALSQMVSPNMGGALSGLPSLLIMAVAFATAVLGIATHIVPVTQIYQFTPAITTLFSGSIPFFLSLAAPLLAMFVVR